MNIINNFVSCLIVIYNIYYNTIRFLTIMLKTVTKKYYFIIVVSTIFNSNKKLSKYIIKVLLFVYRQNYNSIIL